MADIFDNITGTQDIFDQISQPAMLPSHQPGETTPQPRPQFRPPTVEEQRKVTGVANPGSRVFKTPEETKQAAGELAGTAISAAMGVGKGATLGLLDTEPANKAMKDFGLTPNPVAEGIGDFAGVIAPWGTVSKGVKALTGLNDLTRLGRVATQATTGGIVGGVSAQNSGEDATEGAAIGAVAGGAVQGAFEVPGMIRNSTWWRKLTVPERDLVVQDLGQIRNGLKEQGWDEGRIEAKLARTNPEQFQESLKRRMAAERPTHENLSEGIPASASAELQAIAPEVKPVVKGTKAEILDLKRQGAADGKIVHTDGDTAYILDPKALQGIYSASIPESLRKAKLDLRQGGDAESVLLGYPKRAELVPAETIDAAVTKQGEVVTDLPTMKAEKEAGNIAWAAEGKPEEVIAKAEGVAGAIKPGQSDMAAPDLQQPGIPGEPPIPDIFERLSPTGKRGSATAYKVNISPSQVNSLREIRMEVSDGEAGQRAVTNRGQMDQGASEQIYWGSTFPDYFQNKGLTKKEVLPVLDRIINGEPITEKQWLVAEDMLKAKRYDTLNTILNDRATKQSITREDNAMDWDSRIREADDYFNQRGGFDEITEAPTGSIRENEPAGTGGIRETPFGDFPAEQTARTERIDESGWGQQVAPELQGEKKAVQFGDKQPTGRNVGLSEFMDGFDDPQKDLFSSKPATEKTSFPDPAKVNQLRDSIAEGELILRTGSFHGKKRGPEYLSGIARSVESSKSKLAEEMKKGFSGSGSRADTGGYNLDPPGTQSDVFNKVEIKPLELPEITEIAKELLSGKLPHVLRKLSHSRALGLFRPRGAGSIDLRTELFKTPGLAERVLAHEVGHLADYLSDRDMARGNLLGRIASLKKYMKSTLEEYEGAPGALTTKDRARLRRDAKKELKAGESDDVTIIETITREVPQFKYVGITPEMITDLLGLDAREKYPKLYRAFQEMNTAEKKAVLIQAMKGLVHEKVSHFGERIQTGSETVTEQVKRVVPGVKADKESIAKRYRELVEEEIGKRNLFKAEIIKQELKDLTLHWKPFTPIAGDPFTKYRFSSEELYADALSVLINDPALLRKIAPTFERAFFSYIDRKPEVRDAFFDIQMRLRNPEEVQGKRVENVYKMFEEGDQKRNDANLRNQKTGEKVYDTLMRGLVDEHHASLKVLKDISKAGNIGKILSAKARTRLEEIPYLASEANQNFYDLEKRVLEPARSAGITNKDLGAYMFAKRIISENGEKASALGHTAKTADDLLTELNRQWGDDKFTEVERLVTEYRQIREEGIIKELEEGRFLKPELLQIIKDNKDYSRNSVQKFLDEEAGGDGRISAKVYKRVGSLEDIENPFIATVLQDLSLLRAVRINNAKKSVIEAFTVGGPEFIQPAELRYSLDRKARVPIEPKDRNHSILSVIIDGQMQHFYTSKAIVNSFEHNPIESTQMAKFWSMATHPFRELVISKNPAWQARNVFRDFFTTVKNIPQVGLKDIPTLMNYYRKAMREVWREAHGIERSEDIQRMMKEKALVRNRAWEGKDETFDDEIDRMARHFELGDKDNQDANKATRAVKGVWNWLDKTGRFSELWGKVAGAKYMSEKTNLPADEINTIVRNRIGTPNIKRRGAWQVITNNLFPFSNVGKEGMRAGWESFKDDKAAYVWKTGMLNILPKLVLAAGAVGLAGRDVQEVLKRIPDYDKANSTVIPLYLKPNGKAVYLRIPQDYEGQYFGAAAWNLLNGDIVNKGGLLETASNLSPYRLHPLIQIGHSLYQYYVQKTNPVDSFTGRNIMNDLQFQAGGKYAAEALGKQAWNQVGLGTIYRMKPDQIKPDQDTVEKALNTFPLNAVGTFIRMSDQGIDETIREAVEPVRKKQAGEILESRQAMMKLVRGEELSNSDVTAIAAHPSVMDKTAQSMFVKRFGMKYMSALLSAKSNEEKAAIIKLMQNEKRSPTQ
ncbi:MAG: hypothetical protein PHI31_09830 [Desulfuromonadaceae bacterium]|nr:hypothetical protein [Desulfuromonadaceae bacterium]